MNQTTRIQQRVSSYVEKEKLFSQDEPLLVALSGGADSVALLHMLRRMGYKCDAAHCNFHLRAEESDRDEEFCTNLCRQLDVRLHVTHFDTAEHAHEKGISIEMAARELRYTWFDELCREYGYAHVAVAHHRDDAIETLLLNLVRGTGIAGLTGIRPANARVVRPLLCVSREEIVSYLNSLGQEYVTDSTNLQDEYLRNKIRLQILPLLEKMNPQVREKISSTMNYLRCVENLYNKAVTEAATRVSVKEDGLTVSIPALLRETEPRTILFELLRPYGFVSAQTDNIFRALHGKAGRRFSNKEWQVLKDRDTLLVRPCPPEGQGDPISIQQIPAEVSLADGSLLTIRRMTLTPDHHIVRTPDTATLDAAGVTFPLTVRQWREGDKMAPFGMKGRKKLVSDLLTDLKLSRFEKEQQQVVTDANDRILWVVGRRTDERVRVTDETHELIEMSITKQ